MRDYYYKLYGILNGRERRISLLLLFMILVSGLMETIGVVSIMPFLSVLSNPGVIQQNAYLAYCYRYFDFQSTETFLRFVGMIVFLVIVSSLCFKAATEYAIVRFSSMRNFHLSTRLLQSYLFRSYSWFLNRHSADLGKTVLSEVNQVVSNALMPTAQFFANTVIAIFMIVLLLVVNTWVALLTAGILGGAYALIYSSMRQYMNFLGTDRMLANKQRFQVAQEVLGGIKEVKAAGLEAAYLDSYSKPAYRFSLRQATNAVVGTIPEFLMRALTFGGILIITLVLLETSNWELDKVIPTLGVFVLSGQRLLPALQKVYLNATKMRFGKPALDAFYEDLMEVELDAAEIERLRAARHTSPLGLTQICELEGVEFSYPNADHPALYDLSLSITANSTVAFVGPTGSGKTTIVDIILGLLTPTSGILKVDGVIINKDNLFAWQRSMGYVPQQIFLADDSIAANIAFGEREKEINYEIVQQVAKIAELHDFVVNELPQGYKTFIGERGVRLSGGQRQRIGIARALYFDPDVLILDEATSALDNITEKAVMQAVHNLSKKKTIILIAHRLSTVRECDTIFLLDNGRIQAQGTFSELIENSPEFKRMATLEDSE